jgi:negative regulator of sigma E activity
MLGNESASFDEALSRFLDEEPEPGDGPALVAAINQDQVLGDQVRRLLLLDALLRQAAEPDPEAFADAIRTRLDAESDRDRFTATLNERLQTASTTDRHSHRRRWISWAVASAICLAFAVVLGVAAIRPRASNPEPNPHAESVPSPTPMFSKPVVAVIVNEVDAGFATGSAPDGNRFTSGEYQLQSGVIHIQFVSGADVVLRSPARFGIVDPLHVTLAEGALRAIVPGSAQGFTVQAAGMRFVDLGTEFGVAIAGLESQLHVFEGHVDLETLDGRRLSSIAAGQSVRVNDGKVVGTDLSNLEKFPLPNTIGLEKWNAWRQSFQKDPTLVCYYPFLLETGNLSALKDYASHTPHGDRLDGVIEGARWVTGRWPGKSALLFDRDGDHVRLSVPGEYRRLSIAAWVYLDRRDFELNAIFDSDGWQQGAVHWQLKRGGDCSLGVLGKLQRRVSGKRVPLNQWVHLVAVADLDRLSTQVFVNGDPAEELRFAAFPGMITPGNCRIGDWLRHPEPTTIPRRGLRGRVDEFAIWSRTLTRDEIRKLFVAGRPTSPSGD